MMGLRIQLAPTEFSGNGSEPYGPIYQAPSNSGKKVIYFSAGTMKRTLFRSGPWDSSVPGQIITHIRLFNPALTRFGFSLALKHL